MGLSKSIVRNLQIFGLVTCLVLALTACGGKDSSATSTSAPASAENGASAEVSNDEEFADEYKNDVKAQMRRSMNRSMVREWGISEEQANCLLDNLSTAQLKTAKSDLEVQALIEKCGVDPAVVN